MLAYAYVSFSFFSERIYCEEFMLLKFFGKEYREYQVPNKKSCGSKTSIMGNPLMMIHLVHLLFHDLYGGNSTLLLENKWDQSGVVYATSK